MNKEEIKIIKLVNGDDIVCLLVKGENQLPDESPLLRLDRPLQIRYVPQMTGMGFRDYVALVKWVGYTNDKIITIPKRQILTITNAAPEMIKSYSEVKTTYDEPSKHKPVLEKQEREKLSDEDMKRLNEIFDFGPDDKDTIH